MSTEAARGADLDLVLADEIDWLRACLGAAAVTPEAFDWETLAPRLGRAVDALDAVLELADGAVPAVGLSPADCTYACDSGDCDCSGVTRPVAWNLDPADLRAAIASALTGEDAGDDDTK
jgi:hypothetical protein